MKCIVRPVANRSTYPLVDRLFDGQLQERLDEWREAGHSFETIARLIHDEVGHEVSGSTVRRWIEDLERNLAEASA